MCAQLAASGDTGVVHARPSPSLRSRQASLTAWIAGIAGSLALTCAASAQLKHVYIAPDDHTDYFWSGNEAQYDQWFSNMLDYYIDLADSTLALPSDYQSRWNLDGSFWMWTYERNRTPAQFNRLIERVRSGHISMPLNPLVVSVGGAPAETTIRGMYYAGHIERRHNLRFRLAVTMENQTQPLGLASLWAGAGCQHSWKGICDCATVVSAASREREIYWYTGLDGQRVMMKWYSAPFGNESIGGYAEARFPQAAIDTVTTNAPFNGFAARYPYDVIGLFGYGWDDQFTLTDQFVTIAQTASNATRRVRVSNQLDFFEDFNQRYGATLPAESRSYGNEWDLHCASLADISGRVKRATEKLRSAEAMAAIVCAFDASFMNGREAARDRAWMNLGIYWEHNFGMDGFNPGNALYDGRLAWYRRITGEIESYVDTLHTDAASALATLITSSSITAGTTRIAAFNPLSFERDDVLEFAWPSTAPVHVLDIATGQEIPSQAVGSGSTRTLRAWVQGVPSLGYRVVEVRPGTGRTWTDAATISNVGSSRRVTSSRYAVTVAPSGAITSVLDLADGSRQLITQNAGRFANDLGGPINSGTIALESSGPVSVTLRCTGTNPLSHTARVTLYRDSDRIDIDNRITQNFQATTLYAFPFNVASPTTRHEEVGAILTASLESQGGHYSNRNARYDFLTLNHFADVSSTATGPGVTLSNADCFFFKLGNSSVSSLDSGSSRIDVLAGGTALGSAFGFRNQGGDALFTQRFALRAHSAYQPAGAMRFALAHQNPLVPITITAANPQLPGDEFSALTIADPDTIAWAFKPSEEGPNAGTILRTWNLAAVSARTAAELEPALSPLQSLTRSTHIETDESPISILAGSPAMPLTARAMKTVRLKFDGAWSGTTSPAMIDDLYQQTATPSDRNADAQITPYDTSGLEVHLRRAESRRMGRESR
ncbi:MAG: hypothetical protein K2X32_07850 [Phycisphaerales bacterium]|nr:hypothetical protein [Phycisphaerales bacterium]